MANKFTAFLTGVANGLTSPKGLVSNWQHATRLFIDDTMRLAPKHKFNYYVNFDINKTAIKSPAFTTEHITESGLLVKTADLPKFQFTSETLNQYNRKKIVYTNINYQPVNLTLHDDANGIVNALWALYYGYYIADRHLPTSAYANNHYRNTGTAVDNFRYGLDNNISAPFLNSVSIYTMGRRRFVGYTLINPRITTWDHGNMAHAEATTMAESSMTLEYEAVVYSAGTVSQGSPKGFATLHYDVTPSPLSVAGGGVANLLGEGGVLDGIEQVFGALGSGTAFDSPGNFLSTVAAGINTYQNFKNLSTEGIINEGINILTTPGAVTQIVGGVSGAIGAVFPTSEGTGTTTITEAGERSLIGYDPVAEGEVGADSYFTGIIPAGGFTNEDLGIGGDRNLPEITSPG